MCHDIPSKGNCEQVSLHKWRYFFCKHYLYVHIEVSRLKKHCVHRGTGMKKNKRHRCSVPTQLSQWHQNCSPNFGNTESHFMMFFWLFLGEGEPTWLTHGWLTLDLFLPQNCHGIIQKHTENVNISLRLVKQPNMYCFFLSVTKRLYYEINNWRFVNCIDISLIFRCILLPLLLTRYILDCLLLKSRQKAHFPLVAANIVCFFALFTVQIMQRKHKDGTNKCFILLHCAFYMCWICYSMDLII